MCMMFVLFSWKAHMKLNTDMEGTSPSPLLSDADKQRFINMGRPIATYQDIRDPVTAILIQGIWGTGYVSHCYSSPVLIIERGY